MYTYSISISNILEGVPQGERRLDTRREGADVKLAAERHPSTQIHSQQQGLQGLGLNLSSALYPLCQVT